MFLDSVLDTVLFTGTIITEFSQPCYNAIMKKMCGVHQTAPHPGLIKLNFSLISSLFTVLISQYNDLK